MAIRLGTSALSNRIYAGHPNKDGTSFKGRRWDVTGDVLKTVIEYIGAGYAAIINVDGEPAYEISVRKLTVPPLPPMTAQDDDPRSARAESNPTQPDLREGE